MAFNFNTDVNIGGELKKSDRKVFGDIISYGNTLPSSGQIGDIFLMTDGPEVDAADIGYGDTNVQAALDYISNNYVKKTGDTISGRLIIQNEYLEILNGNAKVQIGLDTTNGSIELYGNTPFIDFHSANSSSDFTDRIVTTSGGLLYQNFNAANGHPGFVMNILNNNDYAYGFTCLQPTTPNNKITVPFLGGKALSTNNCASILWHHEGDGSTSNCVGYGLFGNDDVFTIRGDRLCAVNNGSLAVERNLWTGYLTINPQTATGEGGELCLQASSGYENWHIDNYANTIRFWNPSSGAVVNIDRGGTITAPGYLISNAGLIRTRYITPRTSDTSDPLVNFVNSGNTAYIQIRALGFVSMSSKRIKENITDLSEEEAKKILDIKPVNFDFIKDRGEKNQVGVIAEDVAKILPRVVTIPEGYTEDGEWNDMMLLPSVDYSKMVPYLIKMTQIQEEKINKLQQEINELRGN